MINHKSSYKKVELIINVK